MSRQPRLTDDLIRTAINSGENLAAPSGLLGAISDEVRRTDQDRRALGWPAAVRLGPQPAPVISRLAWVLIAAALLTGLLVGSMLVGARRPDRAVVVVSSPMPSPTVIAAESDILATTKAKPLPAQATCPAGSDPEAPGPAGQERPSGHDAGAMVFDRHAGRIVLLAGEYQIGSRTWTYDVCTNTWQQMSPAEEPPSPTDLAPISLVYDADSDRTLAFTDTGQVWSYDLATDLWTHPGWFPEARGILRSPPGGFQWRGGVAALYHDRSGLVIVYDGVSMWAYDVEANTLAKVRQRPDPASPAGSGAPDGTVQFSRISLGYDSRNDLVVAHVIPTELGEPETWTFDPGTGAWRLEASVATPEMTLVGGYVWPEVGTRAVFDAASGLTLYHGPTQLDERWANQVEAYDASRRAWRTLYTHALGDIDWCNGMPPVYDPLNGRIVCQGGASSGVSAATGVSTFSTATGQWRWLLEPPDLEAALPPELVGTWSTPGTKPAILTLHACAVGEQCGTFERFDDRDAHCVYRLEYRSTTGDTAHLYTTDANSFGCAYSPWSGCDLSVLPDSDGTVLAGGCGQTYRLRRVDD
jgi:hypothetical protein